MTLVFATDFKNRLGCAACKLVPGKHLCQKHLAKARIAWNRHVQVRYTAGLCIECTHKRLAGQQRCKRCRETNRSYCQVYYHAVRKPALEKLHTKGICTRCLKRPADFRYCGPCKSHIRDLAHGRVTPTKKPYKFEVMFK